MQNNPSDGRRHSVSGFRLHLATKSRKLSWSTVILQTPGSATKASLPYSSGTTAGKVKEINRNCHRRKTATSESYASLYVPSCRPVSDTLVTKRPLYHTPTSIHVSPLRTACLSQSLVTEEKSGDARNSSRPKMVFPVVLFPLPVFPSKRRRIVFSVTDNRDPVLTHRGVN